MTDHYAAKNAATSYNIAVCGPDGDEVRWLKGLGDREGYEIAWYASLDAALAGDLCVDCLLVDLDAGGDQALELICELEARNSAVPIIAFGGHPSIRQVVDAMQHGLVDVYIAPYDYAEMASAIRSAILLSMSRREASMRAHRVRHLTPREKQILAAIAHGHSNKEAAWQLGISPRTVEVHRANVMHKLAVRTLADLVRVSVDDEASDHPGHG
jgi:two-component system response regulator FixJ